MRQAVITTTSTIKTAIGAFIQEHFPAARQRTLLEDDALLGSNIVDSMGVLDLVHFAEDEFGIVVDPEELTPENFQSIASLAELVAAKLGAHSAN